MLWTAFIVILILWLMGCSIQLGWALIHLLLIVGFGGAGHQPSEAGVAGNNLHSELCSEQCCTDQAVEVLYHAF